MSDRGRLILSGGLFAAGCGFRFGPSGYEYLGYTLMVTAVFVLIYLGLRKLRDKHSKAERVLNRIVTYFIILFCMIFAFTEGAIYYGSAPSEPQKTNYVLVLGAKVNGTEPSRTLTYRLEKALEYLEENPEATCIVSGYQSGGGEISEAECMARWLTDNGVDSGRIIKEERASRTRENIEYSAEIIEEQTGRRPETLAIVTSEFHTLRAAMMARDCGITPVSVPAATRLPLLRVSWYIREAPAVWLYCLFG